MNWKIFAFVALTALAMHAVTLFMVLKHGDALCRHARSVSAFATPPSRARPGVVVADQAMGADEFDASFGIATGIEAMDESYSIKP